MITNQCTNEQTSKILKGIDILLKYYPDASMQAAHDQIYFGDVLEVFDYCDETDTTNYILNISSEDLDRLEELGWFIDEDADTWSRFI